MMYLICEVCDGCISEYSHYVYYKYAVFLVYVRITTKYRNVDGWRIYVALAFHCFQWIMEIVMKSIAQLLFTFDSQYYGSNR